MNRYIVLSFGLVTVLNCCLGLSYLLDPLLVFHSFPFEVLTRLPGLSQFSLVEVAAASGSRQVFLQLPDAHLHLLQLSMVLLRTWTCFMTEEEIWLIPEQAIGAR